MTVSTSGTPARAAGNGVSTVYAFTFKIFSESDLVVRDILDSTGVPTTKTLTTDYSVTISATGEGGSITFTVAPAVGHTIDIRTVIPLTQPTDIRNQGRFLPEIHENEFDLLERQIQDSRRLQSLSPQLPDGELAPNWATILALPTRKGKYAWFFNAATGAPELFNSIGATTLTRAVLGSFLYPQSTAEASVGVTPVDTAIPYGWLTRYGCDVTGATDNATQIANAILAAMASGGVGFIYHSGGVIAHSTQITIPNGLSILGVNRADAEFKFTGSPAGSPASTRSAWRYTSGAVNSSGYAKITIRGVKFNYVNTINFAAALEISAGGWSYFNINDIWVLGNCSYGVILDGCEITTLKDSLLEINNLSVAAVVWIVNGDDRSAGQQIGFTNVLAIESNQISAGASSVGIIDDGGNAHTIQANNLNQNRFPMVINGVTGGVIQGNSFETTLVTGNANVFVGNTSNSGIAVGPCTGLVVQGNGFFGAMSAGGNMLRFDGTTYTVTAISKAASAALTVSTVSAANPFFLDEFLTLSGVVGMTEINGLSGQVTARGGVSGAWTATISIDSSAFSVYASGGIVSTFHSGIVVQGNNFGSTINRVGAIDVTKLANSFCGPNTDYGNASMTHYVGAHNDNSGNTLLPMQNGARASLGLNGTTYGDTRSRTQFSNGLQYATPAIVPYSASMTFDLKSANLFEITATNGTAFTINSPANANGGNRYTITIKNSAGGALGVLTFGGSFRIGAAWVQPANGLQRSIEFSVDAGGISHEVGRTAADVTN